MAFTLSLRRYDTDFMTLRARVSDKPLTRGDTKTMRIKVGTIELSHIVQHFTNAFIHVKFNSCDSIVVLVAKKLNREMIRVLYDPAARANVARSLPNSVGGCASVISNKRARRVDDEGTIQ